MVKMVQLILKFAKVLSAVFVSMLFTLEVFAGSPGTSAAQFLKIDVGARPVGMGGASVALAKDIDALYYNPAGLVGLKTGGGGATLSHTVWLEGTSVEYVGFGYKFSKSIALGLAATMFNSGSMDKTDNTGANIGTFGMTSTVIAPVVSMRVSKSVAIGISAKMIQESIDNASGSTFGVDVGGLIKNIGGNKRICLGFVVQNAGSGLKVDKETSSLPMNIKVGTGYNLDKLNLGVDISMPSDEGVGVNLGCEYALFQDAAGGLYARAGVATAKMADLGAMGGLALGVGYNTKVVKFDYAFSPAGDLGTAHRVSMGLNF